MQTILESLHNFSFTIEFNQPNLNNFHVIKNIKILLDKLMQTDYIIKNNNLDIEVFDIIKKNILTKLCEKIKIELDDEKDLIKIYENKLIKYLTKNDDDANITSDGIIKIIETPLEGEMAKHNKIKTITSKLVYKDNNIDILFYVKYKECIGYNKQVIGLIKNINKKIVNITN